VKTPATGWERGWMTGGRLISYSHSYCFDFVRLPIELIITRTPTGMRFDYFVSFQYSLNLNNVCHHCLHLY
jgi:hypothetical protein